MTPAEIGEIITYLAFYSGWPSAISTGQRRRSTGTESVKVRQSTAEPVESDTAAEAARADIVGDAVVPRLPHWRPTPTACCSVTFGARRASARRDRSLATKNAFSLQGTLASCSSMSSVGWTMALMQSEIAEIPTTWHDQAHPFGERRLGV
jgi:4-carboxymuconolactone decarboxylase